MKKLLIVAASLSALLLAGCSDKEVASVSLGVFTFKDIKLDAFTDPQFRVSPAMWHLHQFSPSAERSFQ